jgi:hypothetical protein
MKLDLSKDFDLGKFKAYSDQLIKLRAKVELKKVRLKRSIDQNSYFHLCVSMYCNEAGYTLSEGKVVLKREFNKFMVYEKDGHKFLRSTTDLDTLEMTEFIEWIRSVACYENLGVYVPTPDEYIENQFYIEQSLENLK